MPSPSPSRTLEKREHTLFGGILFGVEGHRIEVQARYFGEDKYADDYAWRISISGMPHGAIKEVRARLIGAFTKFGWRPREGEILVNLAPAGLPKFGTSLDLPIAMICLQAAGYAPDLPAEVEKTYMFLGELSLHGEIRRVNGALPIVLSAPPGGTIVIPKGNEKECCLLRALPEHQSTRIRVAETMEEVLRFMQGKGQLPNPVTETPKFQPIIESAPDFAAIKGQSKGKQAMIVAAAGGHNILMIGPPGEGKSLLASALRGIQITLTQSEKIELTKVYSAKGLLSEDGMVVTKRPFRTIHHTASKQSLVGGGSGVPEPGEITLAHRGVLFLDELAEFSRSTLETLRQPIEAGNITVSRTDASLTFPAQFTLVAAMNPCPCGFFGQYLCMDCLGWTYDPQAGCSRCGKLNVRPRCDCRPAKVDSYRKKISGPLLDRIDVHVELRPLSVEEKFDGQPGESSQQIRERVRAAREIQRVRFGDSGIPYNAAIPAGEIRKWCDFEESAFERYKNLITQGNFSTRATDRMAKLARTIADLANSASIEENHVQEAAEFISGSPLG